ncbi:MAG: hypothetical protein DI539_16035 [Flavobacterium psychrophilum]|nr:MAG: hypothetical protein DI539_16035 [Flavobacterium psychrophilum]
MKRNILVIALVCFLVAGCQFNTSMMNQNEDKVDGEKVANTLYSLLSEDKFAEAEKLFGEETFTVATKEQLRDLFAKTRTYLGKFKGNKLVDWKSQETSGSVDKTEYKMVYEVTYEKYAATETFLLLKKGDDGPVKIIGYHVDSPGFLK